jgi:hypothetical protein
MALVIVNGAACFEPIKVESRKNRTLVTEPVLTVALAAILTFAGSEKIAPLIGFVMLTDGVGGVTAAGVERVYENVLPPKLGQAVNFTET